MFPIKPTSAERSFNFFILLALTICLGVLQFLASAYSLDKEQKTKLKI